MGEIATSERQITVYYSSRSERVKQALAYARTKGIAVLEIDISKTPLTGTQIAEIAAMLNIPISDLVNQEHPAYSEKFIHRDLNEEDWITMIKENPEILRQPIAIRGKVAILVETPTDIIRV